MSVRRASLNERMSTTEVQRCEAAILAALAAHQPIGRAPLREVIRCGLTDRQLMGLLTGMRRRRKVRRWGPRGEALWALPSWAPPKGSSTRRKATIATAAVKPRTVFNPKPPPGTSWWADSSSREDFTRRATAEMSRMQQSSIRSDK